MRRALALALAVVGLGGLLVSLAAGQLHAATRHADLLFLDGTIQPTAAKFLSRGIDTAIDDGAQFLVMQVDTPGGLLSSTRDMVGDLLGSEIPVVAYVYPPGAQAASAGTFVVAAAHVAAMAPATNIGAASPVGSGGQELPKTLKSKAAQDAAAFIRSIATERGRNSDPLEQTVLKATSFTASEALENGMIDLVAEDLDDLLAKLDGTTVALAHGEVVLDTSDLELRSITRNALEQFLDFLADPNIAFVFLTVGAIGILVEFLNPGMVVPGVFGAFALVLAFLGLGNLPVNWAAVGLLGLAMLLLFFEMQAPGIGVFGVAGAVSFILGAFLLFGGFSRPAIPTPSFRVSIWLLAAVSGILFGYLLLLLRFVLQTRRPHDSPGPEKLVGQVGTATTPLDPRGTVQVSSELWSAVSDSGESISEGEEVMVGDVEGLTLKVFKSSKVIE